MKNIIKTVSLISIMTVVSGANAATSRVSATQAASRRLPTIAGWVVSGNTTSTTTTTTTTNSSSVFTDAECIDSYTACLKGTDVCGTDMEECTTNVLLHAKMPNCLNILYQCPSSAVNTLFGTSAVASLSNVAEKNTYGEVTRYTYPTDGSMLGQMVIGANLSNKLTMDQCVRKYMNCAKRDNVCGENFELCTSYNEFRKQAIYCAGTLARCQSDGLLELFGSTNTAVAPNSTSRLGVAIADGAAFAAANAVNTCYKVIDTCLVNACTTNPWRCVEGVNMGTIMAADFVAGGQTGDVTQTSKLGYGDDGNITSDYNLYNLTGQDVRKFIKGKCLATIGGNKSCYMTFQEKTPRDKDLADIDNQEDVFSMAYAARKEFANTKIQDALKKFDKRAKDNCIDTISRCAMTSCGGGVGSVCYKQSRVNNGIHVNADNTYNDIMAGCEAVVNLDANCQYAANSAGEDGYVYAFTDETVFSKLFPKYSSTDSGDPISAVASLNAALSAEYNDAAIEKLKKQCQTIATGCIKSMCGADFANCYRSRTDIISGLYDTGTSLDKSMNKMGGILDYNIVTGLCVSTIKNAKSCEEHLKIEASGLTKDTSAWGGATSVRDSWMDVAKHLSGTQEDSVTVGCSVSEEMATINDNCDTYSVRACDTIDEKGCAYTEPVKQGKGEYVLTNAAETLLQKLLVDVEKEAQAKYNAKLTKEQHVCLANNNGGIMGASDTGSTFMWVKMKSNKIPSNYSSKGLSSSDFVASNDLYGSFCRAKVRIMSADKDIQDNLGSNAVAYFAVGDPFTCGSWISRSTLENISKVVGDRARKEAGEGSKADKWAKRWWEVGGLVVGGLGGYAGMDAIQRNEGTLGGLLNPAKNMYAITKKNNTAGEECSKNLQSANNAYNEAASMSYKKDFNDKTIAKYNEAVDLANKALRSAQSAKTDADLSGISFTRIGAYTPETQYRAGEYEWAEAELVRTYINLVKAYSEYCVDTCKTELAAAENLLAKAYKDADGSAIISKISGAIDAAIAVAEISAEFYNQEAYEAADYAQHITDYRKENIWNKSIKNIAQKRGKNNKEAATEAESAKAALEDIKESVKDLTLTVQTTKAEQQYRESQRQDVDGALQSFRVNADKLSSVCNTLKDEVEDTSKRRNRNLIAGAVGAVAGGVLSHHIVENYYDVKYENAENEAMKEWMNNVGSKMKCYVGTEEVGSYGDVVDFSID